MTKKVYRFFGGFIRRQENWLNEMAKNGFRLVKTTKLLYEFENCDPQKYQYRIEFIGQKSQKNAADYKKFLEDCGYRVFFKNLNLNYSVGKIKFRPWADNGARIATNSTTLNRELLIVEKENDGKPFELHTTFHDMINYYTALRNPCLALFLMFAVIAIVGKMPPAAIFTIPALIPTVLYQIEICKLKKQANIREN